MDLLEKLLEKLVLGFETDCGKAAVILGIALVWLAIRSVKREQAWDKDRADMMKMYQTITDLRVSVETAKTLISSLGNRGGIGD